MSNCGSVRAFGLRIAASHCPEFSLLHEGVSRAYFHAETQRSVPVKLPAEDCSGKDVGKIGLLKKSMYGTRDAACDRERDWQEHLENRGYELGRKFKKPVPHLEKENFRLDTRRRFCGDRNERESVGAHEAVGERVSIKASFIGAGSTKSIKSLNLRKSWRETGMLVQHGPDTLMFSLRV